MKTNYINIFSVLFLVFLFAISGCKPKDWVESRGGGPTMTISKEFEDINGINVGDKVTIPVQVQSPVGIKRVSYFFVMQTANGTESGTPVNIDRTDFPSQLSQDISFTIAPAMMELVLVSFDKDNNASELHIKMSDIRELPVLVFKNNVDSIGAYFENKRIAVEGNVTSKHDLASISYKTIENGIVSSETAVPFTNKTNTPFTASVMVRKGVTGIIITAKNIHNGIAVDTFKIGTVSDDAINITLAGNLTAISNAYADSTNIVGGNVSSGSDISALSYAMKLNSAYQSEQTLPIGTAKDNFGFQISFNPVVGTQAVRITAVNEGGITKIVEVPIQKVNRRLLRFNDIVLTTEVGAGKNNWFGGWKAPHVFDVTNAAANQEWIDFGFILYNNASFRFVPPLVYTAGTAYFNSTAPYMEGFTKATYTVVTANRRSVTAAAMDTLVWDNNLENFININIKGPGPIGENYNIAGTNRRISGDPVPGAGFVIGWGTWNLASSAANNEEFGVVLVKSFVNAGGGKGTVTLDIVVPAENMRAKYNSVSMFGYPSP